MSWMYNLLKDGLQLLAWRLTGREREVLVACAETGEIKKLHASNFGDWIRSGSKDFFDQKDPAIAACYVEALDRLVMRGFARHEEGMSYKLTGSGFEAARRFKAETDAKTRPSQVSPQRSERK